MLQPLFPDYRLEEQRMVAAINWLTTEGVSRFGVEKVFLEPHMKNALGIVRRSCAFSGMPGGAPTTILMFRCGDALSSPHP